MRMTATRLKHKKSERQQHFIKNWLPQKFRDLTIEDATRTAQDSADSESRRSDTIGQLPPKFCSVKV